MVTRRIILFSLVEFYPQSTNSKLGQYKCKLINCTFFFNSLQSFLNQHPHLQQHQAQANIDLNDDSILSDVANSSSAILGPVELEACFLYQLPPDFVSARLPHGHRVRHVSTTANWINLP